MNKKKNKEERRSENMDNVLERYCTVSQSLEESLKQMKEMRKGNAPKKTWKQFLRELQEEDSKKD